MKLKTVRALLAGGMENKRGKRGRPKLAGLNDHQRENRRRAQKRKSDLTRVRIGSEAERWLRIKTQYGLLTDAEVAKTLIDSFEFSCASYNTLQADPVAASEPGPSGEMSDVKRISRTTLLTESRSTQTDGNETTAVVSKDDSVSENDSVQESLVCSSQNNADAASQDAKTGDNCLKPRSDHLDQENAESNPSGLEDVKSEKCRPKEDSDWESDSDGLILNGDVNDDEEWIPETSIKRKGKTLNSSRYKVMKVAKEDVTIDGHTDVSRPQSRETLPAERPGCIQKTESEVNAVESNSGSVVELLVIPPCQNDEDATSQESRNEDDSPKTESDPSDQEDAESDPLGLEDGNESEEYRPEEDSDQGSDSDGLVFNDNVEEDEDWVPKTSIDKKEQKLTTRRSKVREEDKGEVIVDEETEVSKPRRRYKRRKQSWRDLEKTFCCQVCSSEHSDVYHTCHHLLQAHPEVVGDLVSYLKEKQASNSKPDVTLYDVLTEMPHPAVTDEQGEANDAAGEPVEMGSTEISAGERGLGSRTDRHEEMRYSFDDVELVEFILRWVKLQIRCQYCQRNALRLGIFSIKSGREAIHMCSIVEDSDDRGTELYNSLCEVCGKSFSQEFVRRCHMKKVHSEEKYPCHICGRMVKIGTLQAHIARIHTNARDRYPCGICGKGFKTKKDRERHSAIHKTAKPFKCVYCPRRFTQLCNMKHHMRQHTGEKPYQCDECKESFTHKVSLKNHLKKKHGIDLWKMGHTGGGRPKKQKSNNET